MLALLALATSAPAYESDQLTDRDLSLADATRWADALFDALLRRAIDDTNRATRCEGSDDTVRRHLAAEIAATASRHALYGERGFPASLGFDRYSVALERSAAPRRSFPQRDDVFGDLSVGQALVLGAVGTCSTFHIGGALVGTDKLEHFLSTGSAWFRWSRFGAAPERAVRKGTTRERTWNGWWTSRVFSYADMRANADGYRFYDGLLREGSALRRGPDGCVTLVRPWSWSEWVDPMWDEVLDPPVFRRNVQRGVDRRIASEHDRYCRAWDALAPEEQTASTSPPEVPWVGAEAPARGDPFHLARVCGPPPSLRVSSGTGDAGR